MPAKRQQSSRKADCIRVRLWPRRGLRRSEEEALTIWLDQLRADQSWQWEGQTLAGEMRTSDEFTVSDVVDHLCALQGQQALALIDLSVPHPQSEPRATWIRAHRSNPNLQPLCRLYEERLVSAEAVIRALGRFAPFSGPQQGYDTS